jgi:hypothetical protein
MKNVPNHPKPPIFSRVGKKSNRKVTEQGLEAGEKQLKSNSKIHLKHEK